jgi:GxxExxY protein
MNREGVCRRRTIEADRHEIERNGGIIVDSAIRVHRSLGPGLLESAYQACLTHELKRAGLSVESEVRVPIVYEDLLIDNGYRIDMLVDRLVAVGNKVVERLLPVHRAQRFTSLEFGRIRLGFLLNWNVALMKHGIRRYVLNL